ncbi:sigma-70 family RNA polymerase sigma factor [Kibdelosporangium phytohabitans]|uniref:RNA polymerase subunit sigma-70 n=1 Tax=Kibdelosporangium phytohabitans TaxID=860235 RepID=A0A0N9I8V9_9PSEU|nr:sigma-70 family RNA polymerase sigma factor [Kibdelosporangium phytohabitans]ALG12377.1 RNA polymerase subunit sigma-70 [Kibdelosporangium phytohabitans]MBE1463952.1 RNA polymerase sigma-70 factor (ECF subfamily) [Kibdelosporangium phytohabitans]
MSDVFLEKAQRGDGEAFTRLIEPLRRELHVHCYRILGSTHDADDALQDTFIKAWRKLDSFQGRSSLRTWLYTVATRTCLDLAQTRGRRAMPIDLGPSSEHAVLDQGAVDIAWLEPYPDQRYEQREGVELAFVAALQHLPGNQRAALVLFEVLGFSAAEIAGIMATSTTSVNSALARARKVIADKAPSRNQSRAADDAKVKQLVAGYSAALERGDAEALVALLTEDVTWAMPPLAAWYSGVDAVLDHATKVPFTCGTWTHVPTSANGQPAVAGYLEGEAWSITVLTLRGDRISAITSFIGPEHFRQFGLPASLP